MKFVALAAFLFVACQTSPSQAQTQTDGGAGATDGATGGTATGGTVAGLGTETGSAALSVEVDTSAFDSIERGNTIGAASTSGFGLGDDGGSGTGARSTGVGGIGGGGLGAFGGLGGFGALNNLFGGGLGGQQSTRPILRTRLRSAIKVAPVSPVVVQQQASSRLQTVASERQFRGVNLQMVGRTAVLTGTVGSESDRRMTELLLRLEPGVSQVDNRVIVADIESTSPSDR